MNSIFLKRYQSVRLLGEGRSGRTYLAQQIDLARPVVIKVIRESLANQADFKERFARDAAAIARFQHPFAVALYDTGVDEAVGPCLVMEYVRGTTLDELIKNNKGRLGIGRVYRLLNQLCDVLQAAHEQGLHHGNMIPANVIVVEPDSPYEKIKVAEFGMSRLMRYPHLTTHDSPLSTPYMSPERIGGGAPEVSDDIYSLGVILYEALTGAFPARSSEVADLAPGSGILRGSPTALPRSLEAVLFGCLERDPKQRIHSPRELVELFGAAVDRLQAKPLERDRSASDRSPGEEATWRHRDPDQLVIDSQAVVYHLEAYMPHAIAEHKLRGFVQDAGGELLESIPGLIRVRLGDPETRYELKKGLFSWFDRRSGLIEMYLRIRPADQDRLNRISLTVLLRCLDGDPPDDPVWRERCSVIAQDLRGYLMAQDVDPRKENSGSRQ
jgi:serine/threonine-protein kinase